MVTTWRQIKRIPIILLVSGAVLVGVGPLHLSNVESGVVAAPAQNQDGIRNVVNAFGYEFPGNVAPAISV